MANFFKKIILLVLFGFFIGNHAALALVLFDQENVTVNATVPGTVTTPPSGGNTTSGNLGIPSTAVVFSGDAYPYATVVVLRAGVQTSTILADADGHFSATLPENYDSNVLYTLYARDVSGQRSLLINYPIVIHTGFFTVLSGIRFAPTIVTDKVEVKAGGYLTVSGSALPKANLEVVIQGVQNETFTLVSKADGTYKIILPLLDLPKGEYSVHADYPGDTRISKLITFLVGDVDILSPDTLTSIPGDCNVDRVINLVDFSILAFWYGKSNPPRCVDTNRDGIINLVDFSILAFYWTG